MLNLFLGFIAQLVFINISWRRPIYGLCLIIVLLPSYLWRFSIGGWPTTFLELMIWWLLIIWLIKENRWRRINWSLTKSAENLVPKVWRHLVTAWLLVSIIAYLQNPVYSALGLWRAYFLEPILVFIMFIYLVKTPADLKLIIKSFGLLLAWLMIVALYQNFTAWNLAPAYNLPQVKRLTAVFAYPNALSLLTAPLAAFFAGLYLVERRSNYLYLILFFLGFLLSWYAVSQGAIAAIIFGIAVYAVYLVSKLIKQRFGQKVNYIFYTILFLLALLTWLKYPGAINFRQELFQPRLDLAASSLEIRSNQWQETWQMLKDNWYSGAGLAAYQSKMEPYRQVTWLETYLYPHNLFLNFWTELGLLGLLVFLAILFFVFLSLKNLLAQANILAWPLLLMWLAWLVHGLVDVPYFKNDLSILFFIQIALLIVSQKFTNKFTL